MQAPFLPYQCLPPVEPIPHVDKLRAEPEFRTGLLWQLHLTNLG